MGFWILRGCYLFYLSYLLSIIFDATAGNVAGDCLALLGLRLYFFCSGAHHDEFEGYYRDIIVIS